MPISALGRVLIIATLAAGVMLTPLRAQFVYVLNQSTGTISANRIEPGGGLTAIGSPLPAGVVPRSLQVASGGREHGNRDGLTSRFVYVLDFGTGASRGGVLGYRIGANGALTSI